MCLLLLAPALVSAWSPTASAEEPALELIDPLVAADEALQIRARDVIDKAGARGPLEGEILRETESVVVFRHSAGIETTFQKTEIKSLTRRNPASAVYPRLKRKLGFAPDSWQHQAEIGLWCTRPSVRLLDEAESHLTRAIQLDPTREACYEALLPLLESHPVADRTEAQLDGELGVCLAGISNGIRALPLRLRGARLFAARQERAAAVRMLEPVRNLSAEERAANPELAREVQDLLAVLLEESGERTKAESLADSETVEREGEAGSALWRMQARWLLEDFAAGRESAGEKLSAVLDRWQKAEPSAPEVHLVRGHYAMLREDFAGAGAAFSKAIENGGVGAAELLAYALNYARQGQFEKAADLLNQVRSATDLQNQYRLVKAYLLENQGHGGEARALVAELPVESLSWQGWIVKAHALSRGAEGAESLLETQLDGYFQAHGSNPVAFADGALLRGTYALAMLDGARARRWLSYAEPALAGDPELLLALGLAHLMDGGDLEAARAALTRLEAGGPGDPALWNALGCLEYRQGKFVEARARFQKVIDTFGEEERMSPTPNPALAYALRGMRQVEDALSEEQWVDGFDRPAGNVVLNNWLEDERFGISVELADGMAQLTGRQQYQDDALSILKRAVPVDRLSRVRATLRLATGAAQCRLALRIESESGAEPDGLAFFRESDGRLGFSLNRGGKADVHLPAADAASADPAVEKHDYELRQIVWADDGCEHRLEIRFDRDDQSQVSLFYDGAPVASGIPLPIGRRQGGVVVGVSGQAPLDASYRIEVERFEIYRRLPKGKERDRR